MKTSEIRLMPIEELKTKLSDARNELMNLRFQAVTGQLTDTSRLPITKHRYRPVSSTILREHELKAMKEGEA